MILLRLTCSIAVVVIFATYSRLYSWPRRAGGRKPDRTMSFPSFRWVYPLVRFSVPLICICSFWIKSRWLLPLFAPRSLTYVGLLIALIATAVAFSARRALGNAYSPCFESILPSGIVASGPFRFIRHPLYAANILLLTGLFLASGSCWLVASIVIVASFYVLAARREESVLSKKFPEYRGYMAATGRFVPRLVIGART